MASSTQQLVNKRKHNCIPIPSSSFLTACLVAGRVSCVFLFPWGCHDISCQQFWSILQQSMLLIVWYEEQVTWKVTIVRWVQKRSSTYRYIERVYGLICITDLTMLTCYSIIGTAHQWDTILKNTTVSQELSNSKKGNFVLEYRLPYRNAQSVCICTIPTHWLFYYDAKSSELFLQYAWLMVCQFILYTPCLISPHDSVEDFSNYWQ